MDNVILGFSLSFVVFWLGYYRGYKASARKYYQMGYAEGRREAKEERG